MKKAVSLILILALMVSFSVTAAAAKKTDTPETQEETTETSGKNNEKNAEQKRFRVELNEKKKELQRQKSELNVQIEELEAEYEACLSAGDTAGAEAALTQIESLTEKVQALQAQIKEAINERYMVVKTMYTAEELAQFESAADLIRQMYEDAYVLGEGAISVHNNLIKFDAPAYVKGGRTLVPMRAIAEALGAEVTWDAETQTVTVTKDNTVIEMTIHGTTVYVDGNPTELESPVEATCGRTYIPLRFLAETLGLDVTWDGENEIIDIDDSSEEGSSGDEEAPDSQDETQGDDSTEGGEDSAAE